MADQVNPPRGMRDFLPAEKAKRDAVLDVIRRSYRAHGFDEIETPVVEDSARLHAGLGGDNEKLAYAVMKRGLTVDDLRAAAQPLDLADLGLRFDLTVPLTRFYASHRAELPAVFRSIQVAPVWRAERPQKGRYRQFVQCDIDIIGEPGIRAEAELLLATLDTLDALGLEGGFIRVNDRRLLTGMLDGFGFTPDERESVLITIDKLDKLGPDGVVAELRERGATPDAVDAFAAFLRRPVTMEFLPFGEAAIRTALPDGADDAVVADLAALGEAVLGARLGAAESAGSVEAPIVLQFDPFLVRGMGYYTGPIFELAHPSVPYSLGGGGRYDGMIGRFLGTDVPATGFSLGFERLVDLVDLREYGPLGGRVALVHDQDVPLDELLSLKSALLRGDGVPHGLGTAHRVRLVSRTKNVKNLLDSLAADGFSHFAFVSAGADAATLELRPLG